MRAIRKIDKRNLYLLSSLVEISLLIGSIVTKGATKHAAASPKAKRLGQEQLATGASTGANVGSWGDNGKRFLDAVKGASTKGTG